MSTQPDDLVGAAEAARILDVTRTHLTRLVRAGTLPVAMKLAGRTGAYLFDRNAVNDLKTTRDGTRTAP
jgi:excisionase family DNA binding protein